MDDSALVNQLRHDDDAAFNAIFRANYAQLTGFAESFVHDRAAAEDVVQEVMLELWRRRTALSIDTSLRAYLLQATRNRCLNYLRHAKITRRAEPLLRRDEAVAPVGAGAIVEDELGRAIHTALRALPPRCREVFDLSRTHGLKYSEIAATLAISVKTVEAQMGKALQILRRELADWVEPVAAARRAPEADGTG